MISLHQTHFVIWKLSKHGVAGVLAILVGGCATLPSSGPTGSQIERSAADTADNLPFRIVELGDLAALPQPPAPKELLPPDGIATPTDLIGPGDVLDISIYEAGVALFGGSGSRLSEATGGTAPSAQLEKLPAFRVDDKGFIRVPFAGQIQAAGSTTAQLESRIRSALKGMSQDPQVLVSLRDVIGNSVIIGGEVGKPGRLVLPTNRETLSDAIALVGGYRGEARDAVVRLQRGDAAGEVRLSDILNGTSQDPHIFPGDRITVIRSQRSFAVMGAPGRVEQIPFSGATITLAEAIAQAGGANPNLGDPQAIFVFRFVPKAGGAEEPVVYHLNMMKAGAYFVSQRFAMQDKDVLYIGNARANQPSKLVQIISQLFAPIVTIRDVTRSVN